MGIAGVTSEGRSAIQMQHRRVGEFAIPPLGGGGRLGIWIPVSIQEKSAGSGFSRKMKGLEQDAPNNCDADGRCGWSKNGDSVVGGHVRVIIAHSRSRNTVNAPPRP